MNTANRNIRNYFDVTGIDQDGRKQEICIQAEDGFAAVNAGLAKGWAELVAHLHPQELTYEQGRARYPKALHFDAFDDAYRGWNDARAQARGQRGDREAIERNYESALMAQIQANPQYWI
jgi:hypothetical protein